MPESAQPGQEGRAPTTAATDGFCTCDGDPRIDVTCGIYRHRARARAQMNPPPPPNPLLAATVDDEPAVSLVGNPTGSAACPECGGSGTWPHRRDEPGRPFHKRGCSLDPSRPPGRLHGMTVSDPGGYPFDDAGVSAHAHDRERPVCGGFTSIEWNQRGNQEIAFACTHGDVDGCGWRVLITTTDQPFGHLVIFEIDYADQLHRVHAWRRLGERPDVVDT